MNVKFVRVDDNSSVFLRVQEANLKNAQRAMADAILSRARMTAPKKTGAMRSAGNIVTNKDTVCVEFGDSNTGYAKIQELKRFKNYTTPNTGPHYLKNAGDSVAKEGLDNWLI